MVRNGTLIDIVQRLDPSFLEKIQQFDVMISGKKFYRDQSNLFQLKTFIFPQFGRLSCLKVRLVDELTNEAVKILSELESLEYLKIVCEGVED